MSYKNIIFDVGGVLLSYRWLGIIMETISDETEARAFAKRLFEDPLWLEFDVELRPFDDVVEDYVKKYPEDEEHIRYVLGHLERMPLPRKRTWEKVHELKKAGFRLYLLSNYSSRMFHAHTDGLPFLDDIDGHIISYEVHHLKPHRAIYEDLFERYSLDPSECLFFDDRQENVDGSRKCGMEGRVIYSEEVLLGYLDRLLSNDGISNTFHDITVSRKDRINWLLTNMTMEEKINLYSHPEAGVGRFGVEGFVLGGEASHGLEGRNDQNGINTPDITTVFPNPIGMSSSWDPELIREAGRITGTEARACFRRHRRTGLSRWAPTIDMERDPRWGRNEEGYGEDPYLTSENALAYIIGLQGEDPDHIRCGSTLKHYYANNVEINRFSINSSIGMRDKYEYYIAPFIKAIEKAGALGIMTSYNSVNGIPGMINPEIKNLFKKRYGLTHAVTDGFSLVRLKMFYREYGTLAECIAASIKAGADSMNDKPEEVEKALRDALDLSLLSEEDLDIALQNILMAGMKLGVYDPLGMSPYDIVTPGDVDTEEGRDVCRRLSGESLVLLENKDHALPLNREAQDRITIIGPLADKWYMDWYSGLPPFRHTVLDGLSSVLEKELPYESGLDIFRICTGDKAWHIDDDNAVILTDREDGDLFYVEDWGEGYHTIRNAATGRYIQSAFYGKYGDDIGMLWADKETVFDWFTVCRFHIEYKEDGLAEIRDRFDKPLTITGSGRVIADDTLTPGRFCMEKVCDGIDAAKKACASADTVIMVLGCNPLIPAREDYDRTSLALPATQQRLLDAFTQSDKKVILVLLTNYPCTMNGAEKKVDAVLLSATGSEYMGDAVAAAITGNISPAGRLAQSWPVSERVLPDINDYRIIGKRTYRYVSEDWLYVFGYGKSYGDIHYVDMTVTDIKEDDQIKVSITLRNNGDLRTDEVVQIYAEADLVSEKFTDAGYGRRLVAFRRIKDLEPGESREIDVYIDKSEMQVFDVVNSEYFLYDGTYRIYAGYNALSRALQCEIHLDGRDFQERDLSHLIPVYACDDYENIEFVRGHFQMVAASSQKDRLTGKDGAVLTFAKSYLPQYAKKVSLLLKSERSGSVDVLWNGKKVTEWSGNTATPEKEMTVYDLPTEKTNEPKQWPAYWTEIICDLNEARRDLKGVLKIKLAGDVRLLSLRCL